MALNRIACPECGAGLRSSTGFRPGQTASCPKCETNFTVEEPTGAALSIDDEDDQPGMKKRRDDDWAYKNSWMRYAVLGALLAVLGVLGYMLYDKKMKEGKETTQEDPDVQRPMNPRIVGQPDPRLQPALVAGQPGPAGKAPNPGPTTKPFTPEDAKALLVGNWEAKTKDDVRSVAYDADGTFSYAVEKEGEPKKVIRGQWKLTRIERIPPIPPVKTNNLHLEWTVDGKPAIEEFVTPHPDGSIEHPLLEREGDAVKENKGIFTKKK